MESSAVSVWKQRIVSKSQVIQQHELFGTNLI